MEALPPCPRHTEHINKFKDIQGQHILNNSLDVCILLKPSPPNKRRSKNLDDIHQVSCIAL